MFGFGGLIVLINVSRLLVVVVVVVSKETRGLRNLDTSVFFVVSLA